MTVINDAGTYWQNFAKVTTYPWSEDLDFETSGMKVRFQDGSKADVIGTVKFRLSGKLEHQLKLHRDYGSFEHIQRDLIQKNVAEALSQAATLMPAEDSYSTRRAEFSSAAEQQLKLGIFKTISKEVDAIDETFGTKFKKKVTEIVYDENGEPIIQKPSLLNQYGIEILQFVVNDFKYDPKIEELIAEKKEAENKKVVAAANAEKAKQDAQTVKAQGDAKIAEAKAKAEVAKITEVVEAQKKAEVAKLQAEQAKWDAQKVSEMGKAEAEANRLKVQAGLTPEKAAEIWSKTMIGMSEHYSNWKGPQIVMTGSNSSSGGVGESIMLNQMLEIQDKMLKRIPMSSVGK